MHKKEVFELLAFHRILEPAGEIRRLPEGLVLIELPTLLKICFFQALKLVVRDLIDRTQALGFRLRLIRLNHSALGINF